MCQLMTQTYEPTPTSSTMKRVEDWKARLIDLSKRNNLLYLRKGKRGTLTVTQPESQKIFDTIVVKKGRLEFYLPPEEKRLTKTIPKNETKPKKGKTKQKEAPPEAKVAKEPTIAAKVEQEQPKKPTANQLVCGNMTRQEL